MCESCLAEAENLGEIFPGVWLERATKDVVVGDFEWGAGEWGLVFYNAPFMVWSTTPRPDPFDGQSDEEINRCSEEAMEEFSQWCELAENFEVEALEFPITMTDVWRLVEAARQAPAVPYDSEADGDFAKWLFNRIGLFLKQRGA